MNKPIKVDVTSAMLGINSIKIQQSFNKVDYSTAVNRTVYKIYDNFDTRIIFTVVNEVISSILP